MEGFSSGEMKTIQDNIIEVHSHTLHKYYGTGEVTTAC